MTRRELLAAVLIAPIAAMLPPRCDPDIFTLEDIDRMVARMKSRPGPVYGWVPIKDGLREWRNGPYHAYVGHYSNTLLVIGD